MEIWKKWKTNEKIPAEFSIHTLVNDKNALSIVLRGKKNEQKVHVIFDGSLVSYRNTRRKYFSNTMNKKYLQYETQSNKKWSLFRVEQSKYAHWIEKESYGFYEASDVTHYVFLGENTVFEVLSPCSPDIRVEQ